MGSITKTVNFATCVRQSFNFQKITGAWKLKPKQKFQIPSFYFKEQSSRRRKIICLGPQNWQNVCFLLGQRKHILIIFVMCFSLFFKLLENQRSPGAGSKNVKFLFYLILGYQSTFSEILRQVKNQHLKVIFWNWGPVTIWHNMRSVQFFTLKKHSTVHWPTVHH